MRESGRAPGRSCRRKGKWPRRLHRRRTLGANCPVALGAVFEVTAFDGWSLRNTAKTALETWPGWRSASEARPHSMRFPSVGRNGGENPDVGKTRQRPRREKRRRPAGAKRRTKQAVRSSRPHGLRCFLAGCCRRRRHVFRLVEPVNPQPLPLRARPRKRRREDGRNEPGGGSRLDGVNRRRAASLAPTFRRGDRRQRPS